MWYELLRLVKILDAHVPDTVKYNTEEIKIFGTPQKVEDLFAEAFGLLISDDYYEKFLNMIQQFENEIIEDFNSSIKERYYDLNCEILICTIKIDEYEDELIITTVKVRPCASGYGFYRLFLWMLKDIATNYRFKLVVSGVLSRNRQILKQMLFRVGRMDYEDASLSIEQQENITKEDWNIPEPFNPPSANKLNFGKEEK